MSKALPPRPHIDWLRKTAKQLLDALRARDPSAKLAEAQHALAQDYGFASWRALKAAVDALSLDGQIVAATIKGRAGTLDRLLAQEPAKIALTGGAWDVPLLHLAAAHGRLDCVDVLLRRGFAIGTRDRQDNATALHWAAQAGRLDVVQRLLDAGADIEGAGDAHEMGVIGWATCLHKTQRKVAEFLLARGARPHIFAGVALNRADLVRAIVARDPEALTRPMSAHDHRRMPLHLAVIKDWPEMVRLLLELGADPAATDDEGRTALDLFTMTNEPAVAEILQAAGAAAPQPTSCRFHAVIPILSVRSVPAAIDYYVDKLGFTKKWAWGSPPGFACVQRDKVEIFLSQGNQGAPGTWLSIFVHDVDALHEDYKRRGALIRQAPFNFPWGIREMNVQDLDGHRLRIGGESTGPADDVPLAEEP